MKFCEFLPFIVEMANVVKVLVIFCAIFACGNQHEIEARSQPSFKLKNLNIQSVSVNATFMDFMSISFNSKVLICEKKDKN